MVGSTGTIKTMRLLRSKQHNKRDETSSSTASNASSTMDVVVATTASNNKRHNSSITSTTSSVSTTPSTSSSTSSTSSTNNHYQQHHHHHHHHHHQRSQSMRAHGLDMPYDDSADIETFDGHYQQQPAIAYRQSPASVWVFPPLPPQPTLFCNNNQDALIQFEKAGLKGFRKQFSGRFKRFVLRKPAEPAPAIPPELKCQLKTIYVY